MSLRERLPAWDSPVTVVAVIAVLLFAMPVAAAVMNGAPVSGTVSVQTNSGLTVGVSGATEMDLTDAFVNDSTVRVHTDQGNATMHADGTASATIAASNVTGEWTNVTEIDATSNALYIDPADKRAASVSGDADTFAFKGEISAADDEVDFVYSGSSGSTTVTVRGVAPGVQIVAEDQNGQTLGSGASDANGVVTISGMPNSKHIVTLSAESAPFVDTAAPDDEYIDNRAVNLNATVVDPQGDDFEDVWLQQYNAGSATWTNVTVESGLPSGNEINGSVTATAGENKWRVVMNATGNRNVVSENFTFRTPGVITIYNGTTETIYDQSTVSADVVEVQGTFTGTISTTTGTADLNDINPPNAVLRSKWSAADVENQSLIIEDPSQNRSVVLYESAASATYTQCFSVTDPSGTFTPGNSWVEVEGYIDGQWRTVGSDRFGVENEANIVLEDGVDYRIKLHNDDGDLRVLGGFSGDSSNNCIPLDVTSAIDDPENPDTIGTNATCIQNNPKQVKFEYNDTAEQTERIYLTIYEYRNESNVLVTNTTFTGSFGTFTYTENVPTAENGTTWTVDVVAVRDPGNDLRFQRVVCGDRDILTSAPAWLLTFVFTGFIFLTAGLFSELNGAIGGLVVAGLGAMFWAVGIAPPMLGGGVVALSLLTAAIMFIRERGSGL